MGVQLWELCYAQTCSTVLGSPTPCLLLALKVPLVYNTLDQPLQLCLHGLAFHAHTHFPTHAWNEFIVAST